jgi:hypothetical protein
MHGDNLAIETDCVAGIPTYTKPSAVEFINWNNTYLYLLKF